MKRLIKDAILIYSIYSFFAYTGTGEKIKNYVSNYVNNYIKNKTSEATQQYLIKNRKTAINAAKDLSDIVK